MKMPNGNIDSRMFAPCGMNCKVCYNHCYHKKPCAGCLNHDAGTPVHCRYVPKVPLQASASHSGKHYGRSPCCIPQRKIALHGYL